MPRYTDESESTVSLFPFLSIKGRLAIANGTTTGYVVEALTGQPVRKFEYCVGVVANGILVKILTQTTP